MVNATKLAEIRRSPQRRVRIVPTSREYRTDDVNGRRSRPDFEASPRVPSRVEEGKGVHAKRRSALARMIEWSPPRCASPANGRRRHPVLRPALTTFISSIGRRILARTDEIVRARSTCLL